MSRGGALVADLDTDTVMLFSVPPAEAVVNAWYQSQGNFNTWEYDYSLAQYSESGRHVYCGSFVAMTGK